jgi:hypothetical protein
MIEGAPTDEEVSELEQRLMGAMPPQGPIGNETLRYKLGTKIATGWCRTL